jgi:hypothetical protein
MGGSFGWRRRVLGGIVVLAVVAGSLAIAGTQSSSQTTSRDGSSKTTSTLHPRTVSAASAAGRPRRADRIDPLPMPGASLPARTVVTMEMFTARAGVAVAYVKAGPGHKGRSYLAQSVDGARAWQVTGSLPAAMTVSQSYQVVMAFTTPRDGYLSVLGSERTAFTGDGGRHWSPVKLPGHPTGLNVADGWLWVTTDLCPKGSTPPPLCPTELVSVRVGHLAPARSEPIPARGPVRTSVPASKTFEATLRSRLGRTGGVFSEGQEGGPTSLLETTDAGRTWTLVHDPCGHLDVVGLVRPTARHWILYCNLDGGMNQGTNRIWDSTNAGTRWDLKAAGSETGPPVGNIGPGINSDAALSGDGRILWLLGAVTGVTESVDGGHHWRFQPLTTGGYNGTIVTAGTTDAWLSLPGVGIYRTINNEAWKLLSQLPPRPRSTFTP